MIVTLTIIVLFLLSIISYSCLWTIQFKYTSSIFRFWKNQQYFNPAISWKNKWKIVNEKAIEAFPGSSTVFVFLTDFFHLCQFVFLNSFMGLAALGIVREFNFITLALFIAFRFLFGWLFEKFFSKFLVKK